MQPLTIYLFVQHPLAQKFFGSGLPLIIFFILQILINLLLTGAKVLRQTLQWRMQFKQWTKSQNLILARAVV
jgi:hypothetical protein